MSRALTSNGVVRHHRIAQLAVLINGFPFESGVFSSDADVPLVRIRDLNASEFETFVPREYVPSSAFVRDGDVVIGMDGDFNSVLWNRGEAALNQRVCLLRARSGVDPRYLAYAIPPHLQKINELTWSTTVKHLAAGSVRAIRIPAWTHAHQRAIADYLDRETAQIDAFIAKNEELIALLTERHAAVVAEAVTRGIDAAASQKATGVEWLGSIPTHWSVQRLASTIARAKNGAWGADPEGGVEDLRCVRVADFDRPKQRIHDRAQTLRKLSASERAGRVLRNGDLLLEKSGGGEKSPVGFVVLYDRDEPAVCSNFVARVQLRAGMDPAFWTYVHGALYRLRITEKSLKQSTGIQNLDQSAYFNEYVAVPPYREQCAISDYLERRSQEIDAAMGIARRGVQLARERRAALISAVVTGKIDVRESA